MAQNGTGAKGLTPCRGFFPPFRSQNSAEEPAPPGLTLAHPLHRTLPNP
jgi:hypothetical protein